MIEYPQYRELPKAYIRRKLQEFYEEDAPKGDFTTVGTIEKNYLSNAVISAEQPMIFSGSRIIEAAFDDSKELRIFFIDGSSIESGDEIAKIYDYAASILTKERVILNLLQRLCAISTITSKFAQIAKPYGVKILDTRKTTPGLRLFEKYAVAVGGGYNHRLDLSSGILIKDNHINAAGGIYPAVEKIKSFNYHLPIEVEVETFEQINEALSAGVDGLLLDNMSPEKTKEAVQIIRDFHGGAQVFIESSGGINLSNIHNYVNKGINAISIGALTHSAGSSNIHLEFL
ncbi:MAG: hypothetical protein QG635_322 [Bacteroidota bacterium]|nr:hypothetical protein [Bacteroidota bacterium]